MADPWASGGSDLLGTVIGSVAALSGVAAGWVLVSFGDTIGEPTPSGGGARPSSRA